MKNPDSNITTTKTKKQHTRGHRRIVSDDSDALRFATAQASPFEDCSTLLNDAVLSPNSSSSSLLVPATEEETLWYHNQHRQYQSPCEPLDYSTSGDYHCMIPTYESYGNKVVQIETDKPLPLSQSENSSFFPFDKNNYNHHYDQSYEPTMIGNDSRTINDH